MCRDCKGARLFFSLYILITVYAQYEQSSPTISDERACVLGKTEFCTKYRNLISELRINPDQSNFYFDLGNALRTFGDWPRTAEAYKLAVETADRSGDIKMVRNALVLLGRTYIELGLWDDAILQFDRVVNMQRNVILPEALYRLLYLKHFACNFTSRNSLLNDAKETVSWELSSGTSKMTPSQALMLLDSPLLYGLSRMFAQAHLSATEQAEPSLSASSHSSSAATHSSTA